MQLWVHGRAIFPGYDAGRTVDKGNVEVPNYGLQNGALGEGLVMFRQRRKNPVQLEIRLIWFGEASPGCETNGVGGGKEQQ